MDIEGWSELRSKNFSLYTKSDEEVLESYATDLARFIAVVETVVRHPPPKTSARFFLVDDRAEELFIGRRNGTAGYITQTLTGFDSYVRSDRHDPIQRFIVLHEFTHYLTLRNNEIDYPTWYTEGFADFLGTIRIRGDVMEIGAAPHWRLQILDYQRAGLRDVDFEQVLGFDRRVAKRYPYYFYPASWALVHYLNSDPSLRAPLANMVKLQSNGIDWRRAYDASFDEPLEILWKRVDAHAAAITNGAPSAIAHIPLESLAIDLEWTIRPLTKLEAAQTLADAALQGLQAVGQRPQRARLAEAYLLEAIDIDPASARAQAGLALALAVQERFGESQNHLDLFTRIPNPVLEALLYAGKAMQLRASHENAADAPTPELWRSSRELFRRAITIDDASPTAHWGLGRAEWALGDLASARDALAEANRLGEWDPTLTIDRGRVEAEIGHRDHARRLWMQVRRLGNPDVARRATILLGELDIAFPDDHKHLE